jgi:hypothetical protein
MRQSGSQMKGQKPFSQEHGVLVFRQEFRGVNILAGFLFG